MFNRRHIFTSGKSTLLAPQAAMGEPPHETLRNSQYQNIKGFNYIPSYASTIWETIDQFDAAVWDREFGYSKRFHANTLRIWCDYLSFQRDQDHFLRSWETGLTLAKKHGLKIMFTLSNRWVDAQWPFGQLDLATILKGEPNGEYRKYLETVVGHFRDHPQILMWDLCNEPFSVIPTLPEDRGLFRSLLSEKESGFWQGAAAIVKAARPSQPVTIGLHTSHDWNPDAMHDCVDVISCHPYRGWWDDAAGFKDICDYYVRIANRKNKPLICSETCQGSKNNDTRRQIIEVSIRELERRRIGWLAWQLMGGKHVTARWDRTDKNCRPGDDSVMYWVETDGRTRPRHEERDWRTW